jgi:PhnB protein
MTIYAHLTFNGNCRQAMTFYQKCLGGKLAFQTVSNTPVASVLPQKARKYILQATLRTDGLLLVGTDMVSEGGLLKGNAVCMLLHCKSEKAAKVVYGRLSRGGRKLQPVDANYFGIAMGGVTDRYGYHWIVTA